MNAVTLSILLFLFVTLVIGFAQSRSMKTFEQFALSRGSFGSNAILFTIVASFVGGGTIMGTAQQCFSSGIVYMVALLGFALQLLVTGLFIAPRFDRFKDFISIGDIVQQAYGKKAQTIMGIFWLVFCVGLIATQIKALGTLFNIFLDFDPRINLLIGATIVIGYCSFGGIRAVVATDVFQFLIMVVALPIILYFSLKAIGGTEGFFASVPASFWTVTVHSSWPTVITLFLSFLLADALIPPVVQRLLMVRKRSHAIWGYTIGGFITMGMVVVAGFLGMSAHVLNPTMPSANVVSYLLQTVMPLGFSIFATFGFIAVIMSSADSYLNSASVAMVNDILTPLSKRQLTQKQLLVMAKVTTLIIGIIALSLTFFVEGILTLLLHAFKFWGPTVLVPVLALFFTKRQYPLSFFIACAGGVVVTFLWEVLNFEAIFYMDSLIPGILTNFLCYTMTHQLLSRSEGGALGYS